MMRNAPKRPIHGANPLPKGVRIVHEDDDLIVIDKPTGLVTADPRPVRGHRVAGKPRTLFDALKQYARGPGRSPRAKPRDDDARGAPPPPIWVIHRLDKEASGLVVFAKSQRAFNWLKEDFRAKRVRRRYLALTEGVIGTPGFEGSRQSLMRDEEADESPRRGRPADLRAGRPGPGKLAVTHFRVLASGKSRSLVEARLETGRKNQIRIHFADMGHPLVGDRRFGARTNPIGRLGLHAAELGFSHPATGQEIVFTSEPPPSFYTAAGAAAPPTAAAAETETPPRAPRTLPHVPQPEPQRPTSWQSVADWYDDLLDDRGNDHYERVVLPGALRLLNAQPNWRVLDVACGQGVLSRRLAALGCRITGIDAAPGLIEAAARRAANDPNQQYLVGDARDLWAALPPECRDSFDCAACIMALSNIDTLEPVMRGIAAALRPGGAFVFIVAHPAFRAIGQSAWGWDDKHSRQYRRMDGYLSADVREIEMQPGKAAHGKGSIRTLTFHRPLQAYVGALAKAGLLIDALEEWPSLRESTSGPRAAEENRARREIPMFLGVRAVRALPSPPR
ncbi:MAG: methyltransferase domain-containing protein [Phycisphaeraceae bacterium]|nr:methyltransferase domain-containing protein [Phycisphaeraceae bacterium]